MASARELGNLGYLAELHEFGRDFLLFQIVESLGASDVGRLHSLGVTLGSHAGEDAGALDTFGEASQDAEIVLILAFDDLNIDRCLHGRATLTQAPLFVYKYRKPVEHGILLNRFVKFPR